MSANPMVSFVVPCYKYGCYLAECLNSILKQTFKDFEVLIMDDCSPDNTPEVARSFTDPRIFYHRHAVNSGGGAQNFNSGIRLARGKYVWVFSADDVIASDSLLERYVEAMETNPSAAFIFTEGHEFRDGKPAGICFRLSDRIPAGLVSQARAFGFLMRDSLPCPPSVMFRRQPLVDVGMWDTSVVKTQPDRLLYSRLALRHDAYFIPEPLVYYRIHQTSEWQTYQAKALPQVFADDLAVGWLMFNESKVKQEAPLRKIVIDTLAAAYARHLHAVGGEDDPCAITLEQCREMIAQRAPDPQAAATVYESVALYIEQTADRLALDGDRVAALKWYGLARAARPGNFRCWAKQMIARMGRPGLMARKLVMKCKQADRQES